METLNTLDVYNKFISVGYTDQQAKAQIEGMVNTHASLKNSIMDWLKEVKNDFASQKLVGILGSLIAAGMITIAGFMWNFSIELKGLQKDVSSMQGDIFAVKGDIRTMQTDVKNMQVDIRTLQGDMSQVKATKCN